jgi:hypothetical protein
LDALLQPPLLKEGGKTLKCKICGKDATGSYCKHHMKAYRNIVNKYEIWRQTLEISWKDYLRKLIENAYTGFWAKEVAKQLLSNEKVIL